MPNVSAFDTPGLPTFHKFVQFTKVDEAKREIGGIVTAEIPDKEGEVCHYKTTKPFYEEWSEGLSKASEGKNLGNLRVMHGLTAAGVGKSIEFDDDNKCIRMTFKVVNDEAWKGVVEGMYTGFSHGGSYVKTWQSNGRQYYTGRPSEVSMVDNPCLGTATFEFIRADGASEMRKFKKVITEEAMATPAVPNPAEAPVATTGVTKTDKSDKLEIDIDAIVLKVMEGLKKKAAEPPPPTRADLITELKASKVFKATVDTAVIGAISRVAKKKALPEADLVKGMYEVGRLADLLQSLCYMQSSAVYERNREMDQSTLPEDLLSDLESLAETFLTMADEEAKELIEAANQAGKTGGMYMSNKATGLTKAEKTETGQLIAGIVKATTDHNNLMAESFGKLGKILGVEEADELGDDSPEPIDPKAKGTENKQKAMTSEDITKAIEDGINSGLQTILKAMAGKDDEEEECDEPPAKKGKAKKADGVGDRQQLPTVVAGAGPVIKVVPFTKTQDTGTEPESGRQAVAEKVDITKALSGDRTEALKLMKSATPQPNVPPTLMDALSKRFAGQ
jgi:hypothetical protein